MYPLLLLSSLLHFTTGSVYNVTPEDHYYPNTTCHHCHNLQHYLLNTTKYFTSNTQLLFLPGPHHLHTDLIIQNFNNISLIGSTTNGATPDTVIQCNSSVGIVITNITNLIVTDITVRSCLGNEYNHATVLIKQCTNVQLRHVVIEESHNSYGIVSINILGDSHFSYITNNVLIIIYNDTTVDMENHSLTIDHYQINDVDRCFKNKVKFKLYQCTYRVRIQVLNSTFQWLKNDTAISFEFCTESIRQNIVLVKHCQFANNEMFSIKSDVTNLHGYTWQQGDGAWFQNCELCYNRISNRGIGTISDNQNNINITHCRFHHNKKSSVIYLEGIRAAYSEIRITITNTVFLSSMVLVRGLLYIRKAEMHLQGPVIFYNISHTDSVIRLDQSNLTCSNYIEFANITGIAILEYHFHKTYNRFNVFLQKGSIINITHNTFQTFLNEKNSEIFNYVSAYKYLSCFFQYLSDAHSNTKGNYSIIFDNNYENIPKIAYKNLPLTHCSWLPQSAFTTVMPLEVNKKYIKYINKSGTFDMLPQHIRQKVLCYCDNNDHYDCNKEILDPIYPGQSKALRFYTKTVGFGYFDNVVTVVNNITWLPPTACVIANSSEMVQITTSHTCTTIKYTIAFLKENWCELFLKVSNDGTEKLDIYYIEEKPCPAGFIKFNGMCQCYQSLTQFGINCNINDQTILRPAMSWILPILQNSLYSYDLSLQCPFHYCLPHPSHLNFSIPNSQCQFNRSGTLCGNCQQGLSTVLGSSHCQQCSNIYLFLIVPIAIAGFVLVLLLFILNLTVTDGTINAFIFYVNIISINTSVILPQLNNFTLTYTFISLANLDLGIQTCFYNGMDDYAKMWLQLAFPFYLIFIATSLIITSRYSTTIQRLTARRALPVLATLFLLSYTKILLTVSNVLFHFSSIINLPSKHTILVWSIDANVPLLGVKFAILFIVCCIIFSILLPFNIILLFTRTLSRFKFITKFKPLLDAYQGPYKIKFYYWTGVQLVIRIVFYGISSLERNINLTTGIMLLTIVAVLHGFVRPFKVKYKNYQEMMFIVNLQWILIVVLQHSEVINAMIVNILIILAGGHFICIVTFHFVTYACGGEIIDKVSILFSKLFHSSRKVVQQFELQENRPSNIPEISYNYSEYQEPLIGVV